MNTTYEILFTICILSLMLNIYLLGYYAMKKNKIKPLEDMFITLTNNNIRFLDLLLGYQMSGSRFINIKEVFRLYDYASGIGATESSEPVATTAAETATTDKTVVSAEETITTNDKEVTEC